MIRSIRAKVMLVLAGVLMLSTALNAVLSTWLTERQHERFAYAQLHGDLAMWQSEIDATARQMRGVALATLRDPAILGQVSELVSLQHDLGDPAFASQRRILGRMLGYRKSVSLSRLHLAMTAARFSRIDVYALGQLSHTMTPAAAGMRWVGEDGTPAWLATAPNANGIYPFQQWPAWPRTQAPPPEVPLPVAPDGPRLSVVFTDAQSVRLRLTLSVQGLAEDIMSDRGNNTRARFYSELRVADGTPFVASVALPQTPPTAPEIVATFVFEREIRREDLDAIAARSGTIPALLSPEIDHPVLVAGALKVPADDLRGLLDERLARQGDFFERRLSRGNASYYAAAQSWSWEGSPRLVLVMASSREGTQADVRQSVLAILVVALVVMGLSALLGAWGVRHFIDPILALTAAVKDLVQPRAELAARPQLRRALDLGATAADEVGDLTRAFDTMAGALDESFDVLDQKVQERTAELRQQARYLRTLIDMLPMRAWFKDTEGRILAINQTAANHLGRTVDDLMGKTDDLVLSPERAREARAQDIEVMNRRQGGIWERQESAGGTTSWIETFKAPVLDDDGAVLGTVGVARDVSEHKASEVARDAALVHARHLAQLRSDFMARMSHELRTPLNGILGFAQILRRDAALGDQQREFVHIIEDSGRHLLKLIDEVLDLARIDSGRLVLHAAATDLENCVQEVGDVVGVRAEQKGLAFVRELQADLPGLVLVDETRLRQILLNLLSNAVKFTDAGQVTLRVSQVAREGADVRLRFEVEDTGVGIAPEDLGQLFMPFQQVGDEERRSAGTGLGLAISRELARCMNGDIRVRSVPGSGSVFTLEIVVPQVESPPPAGASPPTRRRYAGRRRTVLVVDDQEVNRKVLRQALSMLGFDVLEAANGLDALKASRDGRPDLVVMDAMLPGMNGFDATKALCNEPALAGIAVVGTSASLSGDVRENFLAAGAKAFLPKPTEVDELADVVGRLLQLQWLDDGPATP